VPYRYEYLGLKDVKPDCFAHVLEVLPESVTGRVIGVTIPAEAIVPNGECLSLEGRESRRMALVRAGQAKYSK